MRSRRLARAPAARAFQGALLLLCLGWAVAFADRASAHEVRPSYLDIREEAPGEFSILFKTPMRGAARLSLTPVFSGRNEAISPVVARQTGDAMIHSWRMRAADPLAGQTVGINGLARTMTDALVRVEFAGGETWVARLRPGAPEATIPARQSGWEVARTFLDLGIEHILFGFDHLLFVLALIILTNGAWRLVKTITAFTLAHSITLALATLGFVHVPSPPVEAVIALSIAFVAVEIIRARRGQRNLAVRAPWLVAFVFGLLHGLGFAGALSEVGLPVGHIPVALLFFNLGVELGQLVFVAAVLGAVKVVRLSRLRVPNWLEMVPPYAIGTIAMFWVIERVAAF